MATIKIHPLDVAVHARRGETVRDVLFRAGVELDTPCNGDGICGKCLICVESPKNVRPTTHKEITDEQMADGIRLACQLVVHTDMTIRLLSEYAQDEHRILEGEQDPGFFEWTAGAADDAAAVRRKPESAAAGLAMKPAVVLFENAGKIGCRYEDGSRASLPAFRPGTSAKGLAIDLGTTTLVASLISLKSGKDLATTSSLNPQGRFGHDVIRRIQHGSTPEGLRELTDIVREGMYRLVEQACEDSKISCDEILDVVIGGNTTMVQIAAGIDPAPLGQVPFTVGVESGCCFSADQFGLPVHPSARVYVPPIVHAYVGADISAGLLVRPDFFNGDGVMLFVDIGTNGEMGLSANGHWLMTATAAGPAFEGMGISAGMRARIGAIEAVTAEGDDLQIHTIGNVEPEGICGSGIIDLTAALYLKGVIDASGRMRKPGETEGLAQPLADRLEDRDGIPAVRLGSGVYFTQQDVRQVQLAKSAIRAAMDILLEEAGVTGDELEQVVIAGGFGYSLRAQNLETIGLIPPGCAKKVYFAGNTSRFGCVCMLKNTDQRRFLEDRMAGVSHVTIESRPDFMEKYVEEMEFPENTNL
ncbi:MAG: ASKHA domain-containing protein [Thermodesulfobacteriota bacterium]